MRAAVRWSLLEICASHCALEEHPAACQSPRSSAARTISVSRCVRRASSCGDLAHLTTASLALALQRVIDGLINEYEHLFVFYRKTELEVCRNCADMRGFSPPRPPTRSAEPAQPATPAASRPKRHEQRHRHAERRPPLTRSAATAAAKAPTPPSPRQPPTPPATPNQPHRKRPENPIPRGHLIEPHLVDDVLDVLRIVTHQRDAPLPVRKPGRPGNQLDHAARNFRPSFPCPPISSRRRSKPSEYQLSSPSRRLAMG